MDVTITAAAVAPISNTTYDTRTVDYIAGASITAGQSVYATSGVAYLADADGSTVTALSNGIALHGATSGQPLKVANGGDYACGFTATAGAVYIGSTTAGGIAPVADLTTSNYTMILGVGRSATVVRLVMAYAGVRG